MPQNDYRWTARTVAFALVSTHGTSWAFLCSLVSDFILSVLLSLSNTVVVTCSMEHRSVPLQSGACNKVGRQSREIKLSDAAGEEVREVMLLPVCEMKDDANGKSHIPHSKMFEQYRSWHNVSFRYNSASVRHFVLCSSLNEQLHVELV